MLENSHSPVFYSSRERILSLTLLFLESCLGFVISF